MKRHEEATKALGAQAGLMDRIDAVTAQLKLVMNIGELIAQVRFFYARKHRWWLSSHSGQPHRAVGCGHSKCCAECKPSFLQARRVSDSLQAVANIPKRYQDLRAAASECISHIRLDEDARKVFETNSVRDLLRSSMAQVIRALELISRYYSGSHISEFALLGLLIAH